MKRSLMSMWLARSEQRLEPACEQTGIETKGHPGLRTSGGLNKIISLK